MQNIVIDTNIIVSAFISPNGNAEKVLKSILPNKNIMICYNEDIMKEYTEVLGREKFKKYGFESKREKINSVLSKIVETGKIVNPVKSTIPLPDEKDRIFYDTAKESNAILITGNEKDFPGEPFIINPAEYISTRTKIRKKFL